jgi:hypothetical protein
MRFQSNDGNPEKSHRYLLFSGGLNNSGQKIGAQLVFPQ